MGKQKKIYKIIIENVATKMRFVPSFFATVVLTERLVTTCLDFSSNYTKTTLKPIKNDVIMSRHQLEDEDILTDNFSNIENLIWACGATLAHKRDLFIKHYKNLGYTKPPEDELAYWTYIYYHGEGRAFKVLKNNGGFNISGINSRNKPNRVANTNNRDANDIALANLASWRYLQWINIFSE